MAAAAFLTEELKQALLAGDARAWNDVRALVVRCARSACPKVGAGHLIDDVASEVLLLMHAQFLGKLQPGSPLQAFLYEACRRVALAMRRRHEEDRMVLADDEDDDLPEPVQPDVSPVIEAGVDAQKARQRILAGATSSFWQEHSDAAVQQQQKPARNQYRCGDEAFAQELQRERKRRGWTQRQMAAYMGVGLPTYISYEHACVIEPPAHIVAKLAAMRRERL